MNVGFEETNKKEFFKFLKWHEENLGAYAESDFDGKKQYINKSLRRIAYYVVRQDKYMIAEDLITYFYHSYYDK